MGKLGLLGFQHLTEIDFSQWSEGWTYFDVLLSFLWKQSFLVTYAEFTLLKPLVL
jgi:hypothetical protein